MLYVGELVVCEGGLFVYLVSELLYFGLVCGVGVEE